MKGWYTGAQRMHSKQHGTPDQLSIKRILTDGSIMSGLLGSIIMAIVYSISSPIMLGQVRWVPHEYALSR